MPKASEITKWTPQLDAFLFVCFHSTALTPASCCFQPPSTPARTPRLKPYMNGSATTTHGWVSYNYTWTRQRQMYMDGFITTIHRRDNYNHIWMNLLQLYLDDATTIHGWIYCHYTWTRQLQPYMDNFIKLYMDDTATTIHERSGYNHIYMNFFITMHRRIGDNNTWTRLIQLYMAESITTAYDRPTWLNLLQPYTTEQVTTICALMNQPHSYIVSQS